MKNILLAVSFSTIVLFFWGFFSWAVLPWHNTVANKFTDEAAVSQILKSNAPVSGVYYLPFAEEDHVSGEAAAFMNVLPNGFEMQMEKLMGLAILGHIISSLLVILLLHKTSLPAYWQRVGFVALVGLVIGFVSHFPYWNWFGFSSTYVLVIIADTSIAWLLSGLVIARFITGKSSVN